MSRRAGLALTLLALTAFTPAATAADRAGGGRCAGRAPTGLAFERAPGELSGRLSWRAPRRAHGPAYRVYRGREVVGQTARRSMAVRVSPGRVYGFAVRVVTQPAACSARLRLRVRYMPPTRPRHLVAGEASGRTVRLRWSRSRGGDAPLVGYRVLRDGKVQRQTKRRALRVPISSNRTYRFTVRAVDRRGRLSRKSNAVTVSTGHRAPPAPTGLTVTSVDDSTVALRWTPRSPQRGRVVGHQVFRDGALVRQVKGDAIVVDNLAAATRYSFSVASVDGLGYVSDRTAPVTATTSMPEPSTGHAHAFVLASTDRSFVDFRAHYRQIGVVYPTYYDCTSAGQLVGRDDPLISGWARLRQVKVLPRVNCQSGPVLHQILTDPATRQRWLDELDALAAQGAYDGLALDFEAGFASDRAAHTQFVADVAARVHARGKLLSMAASAKTYDSLTHPRSAFYDYPQLAQHADYIVVMAWGLHWATSGPGASDDLPWWTAVADYVATMPNKERFILGLQLYGMDWPAAGGPSNPGVPYEYDDIQAQRTLLGATPILDPVADAFLYVYTDGAGVPHTVWYTDATTQATRIQLARQRGVGGIAFWRLGREDQRLWDNPLLAAGVAWP